MVEGRDEWGERGEDGEAFIGEEGKKGKVDRQCTVN